jgi:hypothetical protein
MAQTSQWEALRWACHQGTLGSCVLFRITFERGQVPAHIKRCGCLGGLAGWLSAEEASGWKQLGWQSGSWHWATGGL